MKYNQALEKIKELEYLIDTEIDGRILSNLVIVPADRKHDGNIITRIYWSQPVDDLLSGHTDFQIIALFDFYTVYRTTGALVIDDLDNLLRKIQ